jgi:hypothetical protein
MSDLAGEQKLDDAVVSVDSRSFRVTPLRGAVSDTHT